MTICDHCNGCGWYVTYGGPFLGQEPEQAQCEPCEGFGWLFHDEEERHDFFNLVDILRPWERPRF